MFYGILGKTPAECGDYTPYDVIELRNGYLWRQQQKENTLAALVTLPIANYAGKVSKENLTLKDIFSDGRFDKVAEFTEDDEAIIEEIYK